MRLFLLFTLFITTTFSAYAQAPVIEGDVMLCPDTNGTATVTNGVTYTTYQWYGRIWFLDDDFAPIEGATSSSFTYDWFNYDQWQFKVVVTQGTETFESNVIQIDSYAWASLLVRTETSGRVTRGNYPVYLLCEGGAITNTVLEPYTIAQWYRDGVAIPGATNVAYTITEPGVYHVVAGVAICPASTSTSLPTIVEANTECTTQNLTPVINGTNLVMCPDTTEQAFVADGLITYESYQWYSKLNEDDAVFEPIDGATSDSFMYDWYNYDQRHLKLVVTEAGVTYESNIIQIDSYNWTPIFFGTTINDEVTESTTPDGSNHVYLLCPGGEITNTLPALFSENIQWYRDGEPIIGAYSPVYVITEPGSYHVQASPEMCPGSSNNTVTNPVLVELNTECTAGLNNQNANFVTLYPNPANSLLNVSLNRTTGFQDYAVYDVTGKLLLNGKVSAALTSINVANLSAGSYIVKLTGNEGQASKMFIKQ
jgi:hypothetical protein